ncbi:MAG: periplasmic heavy metal sensor [Verrucomicrobia bacterium]|nr:periplasmic heavy metal sensor [Verrucomicrobiota bacterium]
MVTERRISLKVWMQAVFILGLVTLTAIGSSLLVLRWMLKPSEGHSSHQMVPFFEQLNLSPEQLELARAIDTGFERARKPLVLEFQSVMRELAMLLEHEDSFTEEIAEKVKEVHQIHGALQEISIRRYFAVMEVLPGEQQAELRRIASTSLSQPQ